MMPCDSEESAAMTVLHFRKALDSREKAGDIAGITVRTIELPGDVPAWLELRRRAVAWLKPAVRAWTVDDFLAEMSGKTWWREEWTWLAMGQAEQILGSVTLAVREGAAGEVPVVHWLLVDPRWRRLGIGRVLLLRLEQAAWDAGWRELQLETHANWKEAVAFYQSMGFEPA
ncbi:MAG TPA: GNAT family N-acetyltransferase [Lacipirellulaceae bacterium]|jgi:GNAT superfamily N-acetyltransferase